MMGNTVLGYKVDEKIGSGGFGTVYKVSKTNASGTYVRALKHITLPTKKQYTSILNSMGGDRSKADDYFASMLKDIVNEIRILSTLSESGVQNIVRYYENDIFETPSPKRYDVYILMELLTPFADYIEHNPFTVRDVIKLGKDILRALMACHEKNIIHRDIKDDNIFVSSDGAFKLGDFGISKALEDESRAESVKGTPNFIAPEVFIGKEKYDSTVDLYSLGIVLYKLLNKLRIPFLPKYPAAYSGVDVEAAFQARMAGKIPCLPVCAENKLGEVVLKAIMPRKDRYNTAEEFYVALDEVEKCFSHAELSADLGLCISPKVLKNNIPKTILANKYQGESSIDGALQNTYDEAECVCNDINDLKADMMDNSNFDTNEDGSFLSNDTVPYNKKENFQQVGIKAKYDPYNYSPNHKMADGKANISFKWLLYLSPVIIAAVWILVYLTIIPIMYGKAVSIVEWIFNDPISIVDALKDADNVLTPIYKIIILKVFNVLTAIAFIASLFFVGRSLQNKKDKTNANARLRGKDPYVISLGILEEIKLIESGDGEKARKAVYSLTERLKNESAFGEGSDAVVRCENEIAMYLDNIQNTVPQLNETATSANAAKNIEILCQRCMAKLRARIELKRK